MSSIYRILFLVLVLSVLIGTHLYVALGFFHANKAFFPNARFWHFSIDKAFFSWYNGSNKGKTRAILRFFDRKETEYYGFQDYKKECSRRFDGIR